MLWAVGCHSVILFDLQFWIFHDLALFLFDLFAHNPTRAPRDWFNWEICTRQIHLQQSFEKFKNFKNSKNGKQAKTWTANSTGTMHSVTALYFPFIAFAKWSMGKHGYWIWSNGKALTTHPTTSHTSSIAHHRQGYDWQTPRAGMKWGGLNFLCSKHFSLKTPTHLPAKSTGRYKWMSGQSGRTKTKHQQK